MKDVFVNIEEDLILPKIFNKNEISIKEMRNKLEEQYLEIEFLEEEKRDLIADRDENYKPISREEEIA